MFGSPNVSHSQRRVVVCRLFSVPPKSFILFGERAGARTQDQRLKRAMLYQLSYPLSPLRRVARMGADNGGTGDGAGRHGAVESVVSGSWTREKRYGCFTLATTEVRLTLRQGVGSLRLTLRNIEFFRKPWPVCVKSKASSRQNGPAGSRRRWTRKKWNGWTILCRRRPKT